MRIATDIGGTNLRVGIVQFKLKKGQATKPSVWKSTLWRHKDDSPERDQVVKRIAAMDTFVAYQPILEDVILPQPDDLYKGIVELKKF